MAAFSGFLRLGSAFAAGVLTEPASADGYAPQPFAGDVTGDVLTLPSGLTFGPAVAAAWNVGLCAVSAGAAATVLYTASFATLAVPVGGLLTVPPGTYALVTA